MEIATYRPLTPDDMQALCEIINAGNAHDGLRMVMDVDELSEEIGPPLTDLAADTLGAFTGGALVAAVWNQYLPSDVGQERCYVFGTVHPTVRRHGIGGELLAWGVDRADALLSSGANDQP